MTGDAPDPEQYCAELRGLLFQTRSRRMTEAFVSGCRAESDAKREKSGNGPPGATHKNALVTREPEC
jgi:hypothetical protein